jgi:hypothetical protein
MKLKTTFTFILLILCSSIFSIAAQEVVSNLQCNPALLFSKNKRAGNMYLSNQKRNNDTLQLPFFDDFAHKDIYPKSALWLDSFVYINDHLQKNAISYGVATFDGLNQYGRPYVTSPPNAYSTADTLTSKYIDLSSFPQTDTTIYLSFLYQPMGIGDWPNEDDSLIVEFKKLNTWQMVWSTGGFSSPPLNPSFQLVMIPVNDPFYFVPDFQFRFRNLATSGNNDHWHVDYVYLNANRSLSDTVMRDISVIGMPTRILKNYTAMPWKQFADNQLQETDSSFLIAYRNNYATDQNMEFSFDTYEMFSNTLIDDTTLTLSPFPPFSYFTQTYSTISWFPQSLNNDSALIRIRQYITTIPADLSKENDTSYLDIPFYNYLAYDDGTAEKGYGLEGPGLKKFAYQFHLNKPDTLRGILFHFTHITHDVSNLLFTLFVWDNINFANGKEDTLYKKDFLQPIFVDHINGFAAYPLDTPVYLKEGTFYIGWQQIDNLNIQIGLDLNNSAKNKIHIYANGNWYPSVVEAAPMIRPVIGKAVNFVNTSVSDAKKNIARMLLYPNPASDNLYIATGMKNSEPHQIEVYDCNGRLILTSTCSIPSTPIDISALQQGAYIVKIIDKNGTIYKPQRFIKMN